LTTFKAFSDTDILTDLKRQVPADRVLTDPETLQKFSFSKRLTDDDSGLALAYIEAQSTADIQGTLKIARKYHLPVIPQ